MDPRYRSELNRDVPPARPGEFAPLHIGPIALPVPVVLAPMAGVTNYPFRAICRGFGAGLYVSEMITARPLVEGSRKTLRLAGFGEEESPRSLQLYGVDPHYVGEAVKRLVGEGRIDHLDMNFGCPVPKVTRRGGGSAIPLKPRLLRRIVAAAVAAAGDVPVTIKFRVGIDDVHRTHLESGRIGEGEGCAAVALHARTAEQFYDGDARWETIAELKQAVRSIPVLGNGDIWEAEDALRMMRATGCDGVVVGRGCLGRPWLFRDLAQVFQGHEPADPPRFGEVADIMLEHARRLVAWTRLVEDRPGLDPELGAMRAFRKHASWYTKGFRGSTALRQSLMTIERIDDLARLLTSCDPDEPFPADAIRVPRGKSGGRKKVILPAGYLEQLDDDTPPGPEAAVATSGG